MGHITNLLLWPDHTFQFRRMETQGSVWLSRADSSAVVVEEHAINVNPDEISFRTWADFLAAPDPVNLKPKRLTMWRQVLGQTPWILVSSYGVPFMQQRIPGPRSFAILDAAYNKAKTDGRTQHGVTGASLADNQALPTIATLGMAVVAVIATLVVAVVILSARFGGA